MTYSLIVKQMVNTVLLSLEAQFETRSGLQLHNAILKHLNDTMDVKDGEVESEIAAIVYYMYGAENISFVQFITYLEKYNIFFK